MICNQCSNTILVRGNKQVGHAMLLRKLSLSVKPRLQSSPVFTSSSPSYIQQTNIAKMSKGESYSEKHCSRIHNLSGRMVSGRKELLKEDYGSKFDFDAFKSNMIRPSGGDRAEMKWSKHMALSEIFS